MSYDSMKREGLQEGFVGLPEGELQKFNWKGKHSKGIKLAKIYKAAHMDDYATRAVTCSTALQFSQLANGSQKLFSANFCQLRLCPLCSARRASKNALQLSKILDRTEAEHSGVRYLFLTLTIPNCSGAKLGESLTMLTKAWFRLSQKDARFLAAVKGWFRAIEITRNYVTGEYHPHLHAILAVPPDYFEHKGLYIDQREHEWTELWRKALGLYGDEIRVAHIQATYEGQSGRDGMRRVKQGKKAKEAAKYAVKDADYLDKRLTEGELISVVTTYTAALRRRRLTAFGGWLAESARALKADLDNPGDLVHIDEENLREDVVVAMLHYGWHIGVNDYVLQAVTPPPYEGRSGIAIDAEDWDDEAGRAARAGAQPEWERRRERGVEF